MEQLFLEIVNRGLTVSVLVLAILMVRFIFQRAPKRFRYVSGKNLSAIRFK